MPPKGTYAPAELAAAIRQEYPRVFDGYDDADLIGAIRTEYPHVHALVDPLLEGAEVLTPLPKAKGKPPLLANGKPANPDLPLPLPTPRPKPTTADTAITTGLRTGGALAGGAAGFVTSGGLATAAGGAVGSAGGDYLAQQYEQAVGLRDDTSYGEVAVNAALGAVPLGAAKGATLIGRTAYRGLQGAGLGVAGTVATDAIHGELPTLSQVATSAAAGGVLGGAFHGALDEVPRAIGRVPWFSVHSMGLPTDAPPPLGVADRTPMMIAAHAQYQAEEAAIAAKLQALYGPNAVPANRMGTLHHALQAKTYLEELAQLGVDEAGFGQLVESVESTRAGLGGPPPTPPQLQLPEQTLRSPSEVIHAYPPDAVVEPLTPGIESRIIGGTPAGDNQPLPPTMVQFGDQLEGALQQPPGPPRLMNGLRLTPPTSEVPVQVPVQDDLVGGRPQFDQPITQRPIIGGRKPTIAQPRLPGSDTPGVDRPYAEGPNAGPRRQGELHAQPREVRRQLRTGKTISYETVPSTLHAEDPGTYPPEVRRELATMLQELIDHPWERVQGGTTSRQLEDLTEATGSISEAIAHARRSGISNGGAIPGAPVYHEVLAAAEGSAPSHLTRAEMVRQLRAALLEGRGTGLTDAAAQVARGRVAQRAAIAAGETLPTRRVPRTHVAGVTPELQHAAGYTRTVQGAHAMRSREDAGDAIIGWVGEDGEPAGAGVEHDPITQAVREADDGEIWGARKIWQSGEAPEELQPYYAQAMEEGARRGLWAHEQPGLTMEGPGGDQGPSLLDFEEGPRQLHPDNPFQPFRQDAPDTPAAVPTPHETAVDTPPAAPFIPTTRLGQLGMRMGERTQPALPGTEGVRDTNIATPEVADLPFALTPPPEKPTPKAQQQAMTSRRQRGLFDALKGEDGVVIFRVPAGDRVGLRKWLAKQENEHGDTPWFNRVEEAIDAGDWDRAWKGAAAASAKSYAKAFASATPEQERQLTAAVRGTPLQSDANTEIIAGARARSGLHDAPTVTDFPPSSRVTQAGAARGKATLGPAGILDPGPPQRPLAPAQRAHTLPKVALDSILEETQKYLDANPGAINLVPGNTDTHLRLFRQVAELGYEGLNTRDLKQYLKLSDEEIGQHTLTMVSEAARVLQQLSAFSQRNREVLTEAAEAMSMGGALRGVIRGGEGARVTGARGRDLGVVGQLDPANVPQALIETTWNFDKAMLTNTLQKPRKASELELLHAASYPFMLSRWRTAVRNAMSTAGRYTVDALDEALTIPIAKLLGDDASLAMAKGRAREMVKVKGKGGALVTPLTSWKETLGEIYNFTTDSLAQLPPDDARRVISLLLKTPDELTHFMGWMAQGGEEGAAGQSRFRLLNNLLDSKLQRILTVFNRAQEFSSRGVVFDATFRAQLRAKGLDPNTTLDLPYDQLVSTVGGQQSFDLMTHGAVAASLEASFSGAAARDSIPAAILSFVNKAWPLKLGYPFPKFNLVAAPRWIYDHSPAALLELLRFPMDTAGLTSGTYAGGRLYRGTRAARLTATLPEIAGKKHAALGELGSATRDLVATSRELSVRTRQVTRLAARAQQGLPETQTALAQAVATREGLVRRRASLTEARDQAKGRLRDLESQERTFLDVIKDAQGINAPTVSQYIARMSTGTALLAAAAVIRAQDGAVGTKWYEYRQDNGPDKDPDILDFRPYAPFAQYLYVADVMQDVTRFTNWSQAKVDADGPEGWTGAIWNNYEGKYTREELGAEFGKAFLSISRAGGTTLTLTDLLTQNGWPGPQDAVDAIIGTVGQFLARFTTPAGDVKDLLATAGMTEEAKARITPRATLEEPWRPLADPLAPVPGLSRFIPDRISQTTGQPVTATHPGYRALAGVGSTRRDFISEEVRRVGVPGSSVYLKETGDYGLDRYLAETYARLLQEHFPRVLQHEGYQQLGTPARQRDFLQQHVFPVIKRGALLQAQQDLGSERFEGATVTGESARRKARRLRMLAALEGALPQVEAAPETDLTDAPADDALAPPPLPQ